MSQTCTVDREKNLTNLNIKKSKPAITIFVSVNIIQKNPDYISIQIHTFLGYL